MRKRDRNSISKEIEESGMDTIEDKLKVMHDPEKDLLQAPCFYWPELNRKESEKLIENKADGTFLVRKSSQSGYKYALTYKIDGTVANVRIQFCSETSLYSFNFASKYLPKTHTIRELVGAVSGENIKTRSEDPRLDKTSTMRLEFPVFRTMSLMEQCKSRILERYPDSEDIDELGSVLPKSLILYLKQ